MRARGFKQQDYARFHPSGAIGRAMLTKVGDIMRKDARNAVASETVTVKDALLVMTQAKSGSLSVVNRKGKLSGVFTDGDFRRLMAKGGDVLSLPLSQSRQCWWARVHELLSQVRHGFSA